MKKFHLTSKYAMINFGQLTCDTKTKIISSKEFVYVLSQYLKVLKQNEDNLISKFKGVKTSTFIEIYKLLILWDYEEVSEYAHLKNILKHRNELYRLTENLYDYWRKLERIGIMTGNKKSTRGYLASNLINTTDEFNHQILLLYRTIVQKLLGDDFLVYRQLPAGVNANLMVTPHRFTSLKTYEKLQGINFIQEILIRPPFMIYSNSNKRAGLFTEVKDNPMNKININKNDFIVYPIYVGNLLAFVYIHVDFLHHGIALSNLFETATYDQNDQRQPDLIYVYGIKEEEYDCTYFKDLENNYYVGFVSLAEKNDYFGYLKKMLLTLHNVHMLDHDILPIHGSMVRILLKDGQQKNIAIIGDSGAGKSETLEALRQIGDEYIKDMNVIFDDMGTFYIKDGEVYAQGTEIGAFVRLDDLDAGYAYREFDRAIFLNPDQQNARLILPVSSYKFIMDDHKVDMLFYANNYTETEKGLDFYNEVDVAKDVFRQGRRKAKGTTSEVGLVDSYFANPFGPVQQQEMADKILSNYFDKLYETKTPVGVLYTQLAVDHITSEGPKLASIKLLNFIQK